MTYSFVILTRTFNTSESEVIPNLRQVNYVHCLNTKVTYHIHFKRQFYWNRELTRSLTHWKITSCIRRRVDKLKKSLFLKFGMESFKIRWLGLNRELRRSWTILRHLRLFVQPDMHFVPKLVSILASSRCCGVFKALCCYGVFMLRLPYLLKQNKNPKSN